MRADRLMTVDIHEKLLEVFTSDFDFSKETSINLESLRTTAAKMATYGITIPKPQIVLVIFTNIKCAMHHDYRRNF